MVIVCCSSVSRACAVKPIGMKSRSESYFRFGVSTGACIGHVSPEALDEVFEDLSGFSARFHVPAFTLFSHGGEGPWRPRRDFPLGA